MVTEADLKLLPPKPGVYLMRNAGGTVLYVGKARSLRSRVRSYFQDARPQDPRIQRMVAQVDRLEFIITASEVEALTLESNLIKEHHPKYNVKLRDDKQYPLLKVTWQDDYPEMLIIRRVKPDGARYFGPYTDAGALRDTIRQLRRIFPLRTCKHRIGIDHVDRPCLNHHIHRCLAPCVGLVSREEYREVIDQVCLFLDGRQDRLVQELRARMAGAAECLDYERAARIRDQLADIEKVIERQKVVSNVPEDFDVLGYATGPEGALIQLFQVRQGKLVGREHYLLAEGAAVAPEESIAGFLLQYYAEAPRVPNRLLLPLALEDQEAMSAWLSERHGHAVRLSTPARGEKRQLVLMAMENAGTLLAQERIRIDQAGERASRGLAQLAEELCLPAPPRRIEAYDISNLQGQQAVASMVVFLEGRPAPQEYRRFKIRTVEGANDFAMLAEATGRRFRRGLAERSLGKEEGFADLPDLMLIDGGRGQLNAVLEELRPLGELPAVVSLAKENEEIYQPGREVPLRLARDAEGLYLVQYLRDEAHRFALTYHRSTRDKRTRSSALDGLQEIGPRRKQLLLKQFGSVRKIMEATVEELAAVPGMTRQAAESVYNGLRK